MIQVQQLFVLLYLKKLVPLKALEYRHILAQLEILILHDFLLDQQKLMEDQVLLLSQQIVEHLL